MTMYYIAYDGTRFETKEAKDRFERKALLKEFQEGGGACPWRGTLDPKCYRCEGTLKDMETCFGLTLCKKKFVFR